jgi:hypothetical protein
MAEMTRYEAWPLIAAAMLYLYVRSRDSIATAFAAAVLIAFPLAWSVSSYRHTGDFFYGIHAASRLREGGASVGWSGAMAYVGAMTSRQLGWLVAGAAGAELILEWFRVMRGSMGVTRIAYVTLVSVVWLIDFKGAVSRVPPYMTGTCCSDSRSHCRWRRSFTARCSAVPKLHSQSGS